MNRKLIQLTAAAVLLGISVGSTSVYARQPADDGRATVHAAKGEKPNVANPVNQGTQEKPDYTANKAKNVNNTNPTIPVQTSTPNATEYMKAKFRLQIELADVINSDTTEGRQVAAVIKLKNESGKRLRLPDYELFVQMDNKAEYAMEPSSNNARVLSPGEMAEWRWMSHVMAEETAAPVRFIWKEINREVYPKKETAIATMNMPQQAWENDYTPITDPESIKEWGQPFQLSALSDTSMLIYTPISIVKSSGKPEQAAERGKEKLESIHVVTFRVENRNSIRESVPDFKLIAWSNNELYYSKKLGKVPESLLPGEGATLRFAVETGPRAELTGLQLMTPESFQPPGAADATQAVTYQVGRLFINITKQASAQVTPTDYKLREPMKFGAGVDLFPEGLKVSIEEETTLENKEAGFKALLLRFKLENKSGSSVVLPSFHAELENKDGARFGGERIGSKTDKKALIPNAAVVESHLFVLPDGDKGQELLLHIVDSREEKEYPFVVDTFRFKTSPDYTGDLLFDMYPFRLKIDDWEGKWLRDGNSIMESTSYALKLKLNIDRAQQVMADPSLSKIRLEMTDHGGRVLGTKLFSLVEEPRLAEGEQNIIFQNIDMVSVRYPVIVNFYEVLDTPYGPVKRFLGKVIRN
ncbi:hypothetical protein LQV63_07680 [Paenibacillus profundus]|uniref:Uncharacterized protein n=1 Tax=Paenibacillus profundus TaxID=1173085 RepID=A0ABS8YCG8_9BACL|nr:MULTISPECIES: hypothetical protein [Paenibacillus]MCE5169187.1 hypothetical protein [Paenibacillus profundus]